MPLLWDSMGWHGSQWKFVRITSEIRLKVNLKQLDTVFVKREDLKKQAKA